MAIAELGYKIDSSGAVVAESNLDGMANAAGRAEVASKKLTATSKAFGGQQKISTAHTANLGAQLNDIGVMLAAGQSPLQLAVQQGTQINQVFAQMGGGTKALRGLAAGFMSMVSPMSLATIGIIAGGAALVQWSMGALGAKEDTETLEDVVGDLDSAVGDFNKSADNSLMTLDELQEKFGANAVEAQKLYASIVQLEKLRALDSVLDVSESVSDTFSQLIKDVEDFNAVSGRYDMNAALVIHGTVKALSEEYGVTVEQAELLKAGVEGINAAITAPEKVTAMQSLLDVITSTKDVSGEVPKELRDVAVELARGVEQGLILNHSIEELEGNAASSKNQLKEAAQMARNLASAIASAAGFSANLDNGVRVLKAEISALQRGADASIATTIEGMKIRAEETRQKAIAAGQDRVIADAQFALNSATIKQQEELLSQRNKLREAGKGTTNEGSGASSVGGVDVYGGDLERLIKSLQTERETVEAWYAESQMLLNDRRANELLSIEEQNMAKLRLEEEYQERMAQIKDAEQQFNLETALSGGAQILGAMGSFNKKALKVQSVFAAASALISTYKGAAKELEKGTFGFATAAAVIAKGMAFVGAIKSASSGSSSVGGGASSAPTVSDSGSGSAPQDVQIALTGSFANIVGPMMDEIIKNLQKESKNGVNITGVSVA